MYTNFASVDSAGLDIANLVIAADSRRNSEGQNARVLRDLHGFSLLVIHNTFTRFILVQGAKIHTITDNNRFSDH